MGEWLHQSLAGGWGALKRDPIGILLPASGVLLLQASAAMVVRGLWDHTDAATVVGAFAVAQGVRLVLSSGLRAPMIAAGARALDRPVSGLRRAPALLVVEAVIALATLCGAALFMVPTGLASFLILSRGLELFGAIGIAITVVGGAVVALLVRASLAYAPAEAVVAGRGAFGAIGEGWRQGRGDRIQLAMLLLAGDAMIATGGVLCGAGALPGYPMADLAVLHRWARRTSEGASA